MLEEYGLILHKDWANERIIYWEYKFVSRDDLRPLGGESLPCVKGSRQPLSQPCGCQLPLHRGAFGCADR